MHTRRFFDLDQEQSIINAIDAAEKNCNAEIRVHVNDHCNGTALNAAKEIFEKLQMHQTKLRNGVLFYIAVENRSFAVYGDKGIHEKVNNTFWENLINEMQIIAKQKHVANALLWGIESTALELKKYYPPTTDDVNELPNKINYA